MGGGFAAMGSLTLTELFKGRCTFVVPRKYGGYFRKESEHRDFISIGTAAGMSCLRSLCALPPALTQPLSSRTDRTCATHANPTITRKLLSSTAALA